jgi:hypothetical protein
MSEKHQNGKGDKPRNIFSKNFRDNYDEIFWGKRDKKSESFRRFDLDIPEESQLDGMENESES